MQQLILMEKQDFDTASKIWRKNKIYSKTKNLFYYTTNSDSPITLNEIRMKIKFPNATVWSQCEFIDSQTGVKCCNESIFSKKDIKKWDFDHEKFCQVVYCKDHKQFESAEKEKRQKIIDTIIRSRINKRDFSEFTENCEIDECGVKCMRY